MAPTPRLLPLRTQAGPLPFSEAPITFIIVFFSQVFIFFIYIIYYSYHYHFYFCYYYHYYYYCCFIVINITNVIIICIIYFLFILLLLLLFYYHYYFHYYYYYFYIILLFLYYFIILYFYVIRHIELKRRDYWNNKFNDLKNKTANIWSHINSVSGRGKRSSVDGIQPVEVQSFLLKKVESTRSSIRVREEPIYLAHAQEGSFSGLQKVDEDEVLNTIQYKHEYDYSDINPVEFQGYSETSQQTVCV